MVLWINKYKINLLEQCWKQAVTQKHILNFYKVYNMQITKIQHFLLKFSHNIIIKLSASFKIVIFFVIIVWEIFFIIIFNKPKNKDYFQKWVKNNFWLT